MDKWCPMCGEGYPYVPTHVATLDELSEQVMRRHKPAAMNANSEAVQALCEVLRPIAKMYENTDDSCDIAKSVRQALATYGREGK